MFGVFDFIRSYINNLLIITKGDWSDHLEKLKPTLQKLKDNGLTWDIQKLSFGQTDMEYLEFWVTRIVIRSIDKKLEAIVDMTPSKNTKEVRAII